MIRKMKTGKMGGFSVRSGKVWFIISVFYHYHIKRLHRTTEEKFTKPLKRL